MSLEAAVIRKQEQELLICAEMMKQIKSKTASIHEELPQAWKSEETASVQAAIRKNMAELEKETAQLEKLSAMIAEVGARMRSQAVLLEEASLWEDGDGLF